MGPRDGIKFDITREHCTFFWYEKNLPQHEHDRSLFISNILWDAEQQRFKE